MEKTKDVKSILNSIDDIKELIVWARSQKIQAIEISDVKVMFSPHALVSDVAFNQAKTPDQIERETKFKESEDLFWSSG